MNKRVKSVFTVYVAVLLSFLSFSLPSLAQGWQAEVNQIGWNLVSTPSTIPTWDPSHPNNQLAYKQAGEWGASLARPAQPAIVPLSSSTPLSERNNARQPVEPTTTSAVRQGQVQTAPLNQKVTTPRKVSAVAPRNSLTLFEERSLANQEAGLAISASQAQISAAQAQITGMQFARQGEQLATAGDHASSARELNVISKDNLNVNRAALGLSAINTAVSVIPYFAATNAARNAGKALSGLVKGKPAPALVRQEPVFAPPPYGQ